MFKIRHCIHRHFQKNIYFIFFFFFMIKNKINILYKCKLSCYINQTSEICIISNSTEKNVNVLR